jgi:hypothetical protein
LQWFIASGKVGATARLLACPEVFRWMFDKELRGSREAMDFHRSRNMIIRRVAKPSISSILMDQQVNRHPAGVD